MPFALVPILAQSVAVAVGDRTEARLVIEQNDRRPEAATTPFAAVTLNDRRSSLLLRYGPSFTLTPLDAKHPDLLIFHSAIALGNMRFRRTTVTLSQSGGYGERNFLVSAVAAPDRVVPTPVPGSGTTPAPGESQPTPGSTTPAPGAPGGGSSTGAGANAALPNASAPAALSDQTVRFAELRSELSIAHELSRRSVTTQNVGYVVTGGVGDSKRLYPMFYGPHVGAAYGYQLSSADRIIASSRAEYLSTSGGGRFATVAIETGYSHQFNSHFRAGASVGLAYARIEDSEGNVTASLYPTFGLGSGAALSYETRLAGGRLSLNAAAGYAPALDSTTAALDPRINAFTGARFIRRRLIVYTTGSGIFSLKPNDQGALNSVTAAFGAGYDLGAGFGVDAGVRAAWQSFQGSQTIPPTYAFFVGLSWGATVIGHGTVPFPQPGYR
jgi:hypothetical protein